MNLELKDKLVIARDHLHYSESLIAGSGISTPLAYSHRGWKGRYFLPVQELKSGLNFEDYEEFYEFFLGECATRIGRGLGETTLGLREFCIEEDLAAERTLARKEAWVLRSAAEAKEMKLSCFVDPELSIGHGPNVLWLLERLKETKNG